MPDEVVSMDTFNLIRDDMLDTKQCDTHLRTELEDKIDEDHNSDPDYQITESE